MNFKHIVIKIFKSNFKKYALHLLSCSFAISIFFTYVLIITNNDLLQSLREYGVVRELIYAPTIITILFSIIFIIFSFNSFIKTRKPEFGNYLVLGMSSKDVKIFILFESLLLSIISIFIGIASGIILSKVTLSVIQAILDLDIIKFHLTASSFYYTILLFSTIFIISTIISLFSIGRFEIVKLIKGARRIERNFLSASWVGILGFLILILSIIYAHYSFDPQNKDAIYILIIISCLGIYFVISNLDRILSFTSRQFDKKRLTNMMIVSDMRYTMGRVKNIVFIVMLLSSIVIFFCNILVMLLTDTNRITEEYNPYHIAYAEFIDGNQIPRDKLNEIMNSGQTRIVEEKSIEFVQNSGFFLLSQKGLHGLSDINPSIPKGNFVVLNSVMTDDGYTHESPSISEISLKNQSIPHPIEYESSINSVVFNNVFNTYYIILNDEDFSYCKNSKDSQNGIIHFYNFSDWHDTNEVYNNLYNELKLSNNPIIISSRLEEYSRHLKTLSFQIFMFSFVGLLFFMTSCLLIHFTLIMDVNREQANYRKLYKIGITKTEASGLISKKLFIVLITPIIFAIIVTASYCSVLFNYTQNQNAILLGTFVIGIIYLLFQLLYYLVYKKAYTKRIIEQIR